MLLNIFSKKFFLYFLPTAIMDSGRCTIAHFFRDESNTWFLLMPPISLRYFVIDLKLTWSIWKYFCLNRNIYDLNGIMRMRLTKRAKIFKKCDLGQWFPVMPGTWFTKNWFLSKQVSDLRKIEKYQWLNRCILGISCKNVQKRLELWMAENPELQIKIVI